MAPRDDPAAARLEAAKQEMLIRHLAGRGIASTQVLQAMAKIPREEFVPGPWQSAAYDDRALEIDCQQTISQPYMVALMTQSLELSGSQHVLEVGTGSGYQTAVLAELSGDVVTVERHRLLSEQAQYRVSRLGYRNVTFILGDGAKGWPEEAPYDRILVTAAASHVPQALFSQLAEGGVMVIPVGDAGGQTLRVVRRMGGRQVSIDIVGCRFVPLVSPEA